MNPIGERPAAPERVIDGGRGIGRVGERGAKFGTPLDDICDDWLRICACAADIDLIAEASGDVLKEFGVVGGLCDGLDDDRLCACC